VARTPSVNDQSTEPVTFMWHGHSWADMDYERFEYQQPIYGGVNAFRIGDTLVDTGHMSRRGPLEDALRKGDLDGVERIVLTHPHVDHLGGSVTIPDLADRPHIVYEGAPDILNGLDTYLREARADMRRLSAGLSSVTREEQDAGHDRYFPLDEEYLDVNVDRVVSDGDVVRLGRYECEVVHTPGHSAQHMSLLHRESETMLSGDIVSENGHFMYGPLHWDVGDYKDSLYRLRGLLPEMDLLVPSHGPEMTDPRARVEDAIEKAERTEQALREGVRERGETTARELAEEALGATESTLPFLTMVAAAYLHHLAERDACSVAVDEDGVHASLTVRE